MPRIQVTELNGEVQWIDADEGITLMEALKNAGCDEIEAICGGACSCSTCHVYVLAGGFSALGGRNEGEQLLVEESAHYQDNSRLSCQVVLTAAMDHLHVAVAPMEG